MEVYEKQIGGQVMSREPHPLIANVSQSLRTPVIGNAMFAFSVLTGQFLPFSRCETSVEEKPARREQNSQILKGIVKRTACHLWETMAGSYRNIPLRASQPCLSDHDKGLWDGRL